MTYWLLMVWNLSIYGYLLYLYESLLLIVFCGLLQEQGTVMVTETESYDKAILQKLFPNISVSDKMVRTVWNLAMRQLLNKRRFYIYHKDYNDDNMLYGLQSHKDWMTSFEKQALVQIKTDSEKKDDVRKLYFFFEEVCKLLVFNRFLWMHMQTWYMYLMISPWNVILVWFVLQSAKLKELEDSKKSLQTQVLSLQKEVSEVGIFSSLLDK